MATFTEPVHLTGAIDAIPRAFIRCTGGTIDLGGDPIAAAAARAKDAGWPSAELSAPHDPHLFDPDEVAGLLLDMAAPRA